MAQGRLCKWVSVALVVSMVPRFRFKLHLKRDTEVVKYVVYVPRIFSEVKMILKHISSQMTIVPSHQLNVT